MKRTILSIIILFLSISVSSQELIANKKFDFALILEQSKNEDFKFTPTNFYTQENKNPVLSFISYVEFPILEEKKKWKFGETKKEYASIINLDNSYNRASKFINFSIHVRGSYPKSSQMKILKGYDFCGRPIY